ncbi:tripeptidyl-peptidase 2 isoform X2 [Teleopsis dalmanni]|uniref:tripeptidyl-peptidase 2 isoform X2 n=1 Tax=Teleopsis dalmanni TaxID=139649 RepID=UPI0018CCA5C0|nr:tripeptidyl-peptidase 2 isoform X2 [Teleopsis dalmanni]
MSSATGIIDGNFPAGALVPKAETGVVNFLQKYPNYDGKDVTIAIFDSGVDPQACGLQTLVNGKSVKVIERYDCTGCGDLDTATKVTADEKGYIVGLSGRKLKLTSDMISANTAKGEYRVGLKAVHDLCPAKIRENMMTALKRKTFDVENKSAIADISRKINEFDTENTNASKLTWDKKLVKENLDATLELLNGYDKLFIDIRLCYDCVLYPTENGWRAAIDTTEKGDLENAVHIGEYTKTHEMKNLNEYLSVSINVHDNGDVLEIVGMSSSHGTHVASIASGSHSCNDVNGVAPNAKIVSLTIGDGRLSSMETGTALARAMMKVMEMCSTGRKIDVINMSYGEHSHWTNSGRIGELMSEVSNKYGVVWVVSAGNHGPALGTVGTPPDISQPCCIGVGAYVSPQMMEAEYVLREKLPANVYTWTSRDPCIDGGQGVTVCAPGGAITSVPQFTMCKSQLMNGTSMAAPHVAGAVGLLISGLKQKNIAYTPFSIKRAITATATKLSYVDPFAQGSGLLNVEKAFDHLIEHANAPENMIRFSVRCGVEGAKGIHVRNSVLNRVLEYKVNVEPKYFNEADANPTDKINFNMRLNLLSSQPFVKCGAYLDMSYTLRTIPVTIDPSGLPPGVHTAVIRAYDSSCVQKGSVFEIPITLVQPHVMNCEESRIFEPSGCKTDAGIEFQPNTIQRDFILVPKNATWAVLRMRTVDMKRDDEIGKFFIHTMQLLPRASCRVLETMKFVDVKADNTTTVTFACQENNILELCVAKYWSNLGSTHLKYNLEFHGIRARNYNPFVHHGGIGLQKLVLNSIGTEEIQPQVALKTAVTLHKPNETKISPLSSTRDIIPEGRQIYQNILSYNINVPKAQEISIHVPFFNDLLYESEFESQFWMLFDCNKTMCMSGDSNSRKSSGKVDKGDYVLKLQVRHEKRDLLQKISDASIVVEYKLPNTITVDLYDQYNQGLINGRKYSTGIIRPNQDKVLYVGLVSQDKLSKLSLPPNCSYLHGTIHFAKDETVRRVDSYGYSYILGPMEKKNGNGNGNGSGNGATKNGAKPTNDPAPAPAATTGGGDAAPPLAQSASSTAVTTEEGSPKKNKVSNDDYKENLRDFKCGMIAKCELDMAEKIYAEIVAEHPKHLVPHLLMIQLIETPEQKAIFPFTFENSLKQDVDSDKSKEDTQENSITKLRIILERIVKLSDIIIKETEKDALLTYYGMKFDSRENAAKIKCNMDKQKNTLIEAFVKKGIALIKLGILDNNLSTKSKDLDDIYLDILRYVEVTDSKVIPFALWYAYSKSQYGRMYKLLLKSYEEKKNKEVFEEIALVNKALNFEHLKVLQNRWTLYCYPKTYRIF